MDQCCDRGMVRRLVDSVRCGGVTGDLPCGVPVAVPVAASAVAQCVDASRKLQVAEAPVGAVKCDDAATNANLQRRQTGHLIATWQKP